MVVTAIAAIWMAWSLLGEARYAFRSSQPVDIGVLSGPSGPPKVENTYVQASGILDTNGAIHYSRAGEGDSFRLSPVVGNPRVWVEIRVPEAVGGPHFLPPTSFVGRLVRFQNAGVRHAGLRKAVLAQTGVIVPEDAWLVIDGVITPRFPVGPCATLLLRGLRGVERRRRSTGIGPRASVEEVMSEFCDAAISPFATLQLT